VASAAARGECPGRVRLDGRLGGPS
jgi:hypothetical protein